MLKTIRKKIHEHLPLVLALIIFLSGTFVLLDNGQHYAFNLEPYPDGLFYVIPAWNFVFDNDFSMKFTEATIRSEVPPLYSLLLIPFYFIFQTPVVFYFVNVLLGSGTLIFLYYLLKEVVRKPTTIFLILLLAASPILWWLPALPMAESLLLLLVTSNLWLWKTKKISEKRRLLLLALLPTLIFITKYSSYAFIIAFNLIFGWQLMRKGEHKKLILYSLLSAFLFIGAVILVKPPFIVNTINSFQTNSSPTASQPSSSLVVFSTAYLATNLPASLRAILGIPTTFLWERVGFLPFGLLAFPVLKLIFGIKNKRTKKLHPEFILILGTLFFQAFFYDFDARYLVPVLPAAFLLVAKSFDHYQKLPRYFFFFLGSFLLVNIIVNAHFYRKIIGSNWLQRSNAWQYEAINHFNQALSADELIITALPPFLMNVYQTENYRVLPLSKSQEFLDKKRLIWGNDLDYQNLERGYRKWLEEGKRLYISNAYITHQSAVIEDYENYKQNFDFELISRGCFEACNVYQLSLKRE